MIFSIDDILNPKYLGPIGAKGLIMESYNRRYELIKDRIMWAACRNGPAYVVHIRIPSEHPNRRDIFYDIVLEFIPTSKNDEKKSTFNSYSLRLFSNVPSFSYSFTYVYNKYKILIPWLTGKCMHMCLTTPPVRKNPNMIVAADMKTWLAVKFFKELDIFNKQKFSTMINTDMRYLEKIVIGQHQMLAIIQAAEKMNKEEARRKFNVQDLVKIRHDEYVRKRDLEKAVIDYNAKKDHTPVNPRVVAARAAKGYRVARQARGNRNPRQPRQPRRKR